MGETFRFLDFSRVVSFNRKSGFHESREQNFVQVFGSHD